MAHHYLCPIRWGDMDAQGHVNNAVFVDYLQEARVHFLVSGPPEMGAMLDAGVLVVQHQVEYLRPVTFSAEPLPIELWVDAVGGSRFVIAYEARVPGSGEVAVRARTVCTPYDLAAGRLRRLSAEERAHLVAELRPSESLPAEPRVSCAGGHRYDCTVRWADLDSYGHVNNVKYYDYIQEARIALMAQTLGWSGQPSEPWVVVRQDVDYLIPLDFRLEPYLIETVVTAVGRRSVRLAAEISDPATGRIFAAGRTVLVGPAPLDERARESLGSTPSNRVSKIVSADT